MTEAHTSKCEGFLVVSPITSDISNTLNNIAIHPHPRLYLNKTR